MTARTRSPLAGRRAVVVNWRDPWHSLAGGSERFAWEFARALHAAGARVEFLTARESAQHAAEIRNGIEIRRAGGPFTFYAHAALMLLRRRRRLDIVVDPECGIPTFHRCSSAATPRWCWCSTTCTRSSSGPTSRPRWPGSGALSNAL